MKKSLASLVVIIFTTMAISIVKADDSQNGVRANDYSESALKLAMRNAEKSDRAMQVPRKDLMRHATFRDINLSPDGHWLSFRHEKDKRVELWLRNIASGEDYRVMADSEDVDVKWSGDGARLWLPDEKGLAVFEIDSMMGRRIVRYDEDRGQKFWSLDHNFPDAVIIREKIPVDGKWQYRYLTVDGNGKTRLLRETKSTLLHLLLDRKGILRYASGYDGKKFDTVIWRFDNNARHELMRCPLPQQCRPVAFHESDTGDTLWALAHGDENLMSLQKLEDGAKQWQTVHSDPRGIADAVSLLMQADNSDWLAMAYRPDKVEWHGRTLDTKHHLDKLAEQFPRANFDFTVSNNGQRWLLGASKANWQYDRYFLYEVEQQSLTPVFSQEREARIASTQLIESVPIDWRGKDGMILYGYLYLPNGVPLESAPLIAILHGGPYNRSNGGEDIATQLLVNRGYVVFKPNFRASTGHGVDYVTAARGDFGREGVLDDIITGMDYLLANGIGDKNKQAVLGHSFGGYASLLAVTHYPDRFAFAVPSAAPVDMAWTMADIAIEGGSALSSEGPPVEILFPGYGVPYGEKSWHQKMQRDSPLAHSERLSTPLYLWAGANDDRVALETLVRYFAESNKEFKPALLIDPKSGHSPHERLNVEALAWLIEASADKHFGGGVSPPSRELKQFLMKNLQNGSTNLLDKKDIGTEE
ncbi:alpha/beta hydrolase family protein [Kangiella shandongensis]|uniref:alpha/beta hydrolase family protein n=1 Tax=Kangiella shandongensis TaxID=2763258 RepID=UPI001CBD8621|nr:prolyl oligopeptidase family serine peptidase [Kangiella shandongensis]